MPTSNLKKTFTQIVKFSPIRFSRRGSLLNKNWTKMKNINIMVWQQQKSNMIKTWILTVLYLHPSKLSKTNWGEEALPNLTGGGSCHFLLNFYKCGLFDFDVQALGWFKNR